jgi:hypothetical protein
VLIDNRVISEKLIGKNGEGRGNVIICMLEDVRNTTRDLSAYPISEPIFKSRIFHIRRRQQC